MKAMANTTSPLRCRRRKVSSSLSLGRSFQAIEGVVGVCFVELGR